MTRAYDLLSDAKKRGQYDRGEIDENGQARAPLRLWRAMFGGGGTGRRLRHLIFGGGIDLGDIFDGMFGGGGAGARPQGGPRAQQAPPPEAQMSLMNILFPLPTRPR